MKKINFDFHVFVMRLAAVLLSLVMLTTGMISGRYARYVSGASGSDSARVAKFSVTQAIVYNGESLSASIRDVEILPGQTVVINVIVDYNMEVAAKSTITATNSYEGVPGNLPLSFVVYEPGTDDGAATTGTYSFVANCHSGEYQKEFVVQATFPDTGNPQAYIGMVDFLTVSVTTEQID